MLGKRDLTTDTAVRLAAALGTSAKFWLGLQADHDLEEAHRLLGDAVQADPEDRSLRAQSEVERERRAAHDADRHAVEGEIPGHRTAT